MVEQVSALMLFAVGAVAHHNHSVLNSLKETAQYMDDSSGNTKVDGVRIRTLSLDAERVSVHQIGIYAAYRGKIQVIVDTVPADKRVVKWILLDYLIWVLRIGNHTCQLFVSFLHDWPRFGCILSSPA